MTKPRLQELVREVDPNEQLDEEVEDILLQIADDFVENAINGACLLAKHRKQSKVEIRDVQVKINNYIFLEVYMIYIYLFCSSSLNVTGTYGYRDLELKN